MSSTLKRFDEICYSALRWLIAFLLLVMFIVIMLEVIFRYVVDSPAFWTEELARYVMFYMVFLGSAVAVREDRHPALTFITQKFPRKFLKWWRLVLDGLVFLVLIIIFKEGYLMAADEKIMRTPALRLSFFWVYLAFPIGAFLMMLQILARHVFRERPFPERENNESTHDIRRLDE